MPDILKALGIGTYTDANGNVITNSDLPPDVRQKIEPLGAFRDLSHMAGDTAREQMLQQQINDLYNPRTREPLMAKSAGEELVRVLQERLAKPRKRK